MSYAPPPTTAVTSAVAPPVYGAMPMAAPMQTMAAPTSMVVGPDMNRDGIPDFMQGGGMGMPAMGMPAMGMPAMAAPMSYPSYPMSYAPPMAMPAMAAPSMSYAPPPTTAVTSAVAPPVYGAMPMAAPMQTM